MPTCCTPCKAGSGPCSGRVGSRGVCSNIARDLASSRMGREGCGDKQWTSCVSPKPLCVPGLKMTDIRCNAEQGRSNLQGLNNTLAAHHDHVRALCAKAAGSADPKIYKEAIATLENEVKHVRSMYEQEICKMRKQLDDVNQDRGCLVAKAGAHSNWASSLQAKLSAVESTNQKAHENLAQLQSLLAQKEKEVCDLRACLDTRDRELSQLRPRINQLLCEVEELRSRLAQETQNRVVAEERTRELSNQYNFDRTAACEANKDLQDRLNAAKDVIQCLEKKVSELTSWAAQCCDTSGLFNQLRDDTCQELNKYKKEAESALNGVLDAMKCQRDADNHAKANLTRDKACLDDALRQTQGRLAEVQAQLAACCEDKSTVESALEKEKACAQARITDLEHKLNQLTDLVANKVKDATEAREAQVALNTEIGAYRTLLEKQEAQFANCIPCVPCSPRPAQARPVPEVPREPITHYRDRTDMPTKCAPCTTPTRPQAYQNKPLPENIYHRQGDYGLPVCGPSKPFVPSGATGLAKPRSPPAEPEEVPFICPKGKGSACTCPRPGKPQQLQPLLGSQRQAAAAVVAAPIPQVQYEPVYQHPAINERFQTTYMKSFSPSPSSNKYGTNRNACFRRC